MTPLAPSPLDAQAEELLVHVRQMLRIRAFERRVAQHFRDGDVHGFVHTSIGQEAVAAGVCSALRSEDSLFTTHRGHGHCLAKGADPTRMMAELFGRSTGSCRGKGGSMHLADTSAGVLGANGIVGAGIPLAVGVALAAKVRHEQRVCVAFFGEGAVHTGAFHEGIGLAAIWRVPLVLVCENNGYAEFTAAHTWGGPSPAERAAAYGVATHTVDGNDVLAVADLARSARATALSEGPVFVEAVTYRVSGHYEGDPTHYRPGGEQDDWRDRDPVLLARRRLAELGGDALIAAEEEAVEHEMDGVVAGAFAAPYPTAAALLEDVDD